MINLEKIGESTGNLVVISFHIFIVILFLTFCVACIAGIIELFKNLF